MIVEILNRNINNQQLKNKFKINLNTNNNKDQVKLLSNGDTTTLKKSTNSDRKEANFLPNHITSQLIMKKLIKRSQNTHRFTQGKNKQCDKRLDLETSILEKDYAYEDSNWLKDYINSKKSLNLIRSSSRIYQNNNKLIQNQSRASTSLNVYKTQFIDTDSESNNSETNLSNYLPFKIPRSYTSMIGRHKDKCLDEIKMFSFKKIENNESRASTSNSTNYSSMDNLLWNGIEETLNEYKSIRRPLKRDSASSKDVTNKIKSLENKCNFCREQTLINIKMNDRNVRYGDPAPRNKKFKQLKLIAQLETIVK